MGSVGTIAARSANRDHRAILGSPSFIGSLAGLATTSFFREAGNPEIGSGGKNRTPDLQVMSLTSYRCSTPLESFVACHLGEAQPQPVVASGLSCSLISSGSIVSTLCVFESRRVQPAEPQSIGVEISDGKSPFVFNRVVIMLVSGSGPGSALAKTPANCWRSGISEPARLVNGGSSKGTNETPVPTYILLSTTSPSPTASTSRKHSSGLR
jgi:hypothetical protein